MKKMKRWSKAPELIIDPSPEIKISELISEYASDYIDMGESTEQRQRYLNGACTAWNIANLDETGREKAIRLVIEDFKRTNPAPGGAESLERDLRKLVQKKLEMFPNIKKIIVDASIEPISEREYKINIGSTYNKELVKRFSKRV